MALPGTPEKLVWENCPCGHQVCKRSNPANLGHFNVGAGFEPDEAAELDRRWNLYPELVGALVGLLPDFTGGLDPYETPAVQKARAVYAKAKAEIPGSSPIRSEGPETDCPELERTSADQSANGRSGIVDRLRKVESSRDPARGFAGGRATNWYRNPDGPEAANIIETLVAALEPLEQEGVRRDAICPGADIDHWPIGGNYLTYGDIRRAREALAKARGEQP